MISESKAEGEPMELQCTAEWPPDSREAIQLGERFMSSRIFKRSARAFRAPRIASQRIVNLDQSSREGGVDRFRTTRWDIVLLSAQSEAPGYREALAELCNLYWYPLYAFVRRRGHSPEDAEDLIQGFFLDLLEHKALTRVDPQNGKFRSFLLASLRNYVANEARSTFCLNRGAQVE